MTKFSPIVFFLFYVGTAGFSQINTFYVKPVQTDINYAAVQDSHLVVRNTTTQNNKLFLFIGGTGSNTKGYLAISNFAGNLGYDVINISYPNNVAAYSLTNSSDSMVFNKYRQEVCYGTPLCPYVTVDSLNSIYVRTVKLINYLNTTYPSQNWNQYLMNPTTLNWSKIAIAGHSQGAGHACYFAKFNDVERILMFSGPNDYSDFFSNSANWLRTPGVSSMNKHFAFLSLLDEMVPFQKQLINLQGLGLFPLYDTTSADNTGSPYGNSHCLYTTQPPGNSNLYHNSTVKPSSTNNSVWTYMLASPIMGVRENVSHLLFSTYPNPVYSVVTIRSNTNLFDKPFVVYDIAGKIILKGKSNRSELLSIDFSSFESGIYFISINNKTIKIVKQ